MGDRCKGHCCRDFTLDQSPEEIAALPYVLGADGKPMFDGNGDPYLARDGAQIRDMLISLGRYKYGPGLARADIIIKERHHYTCKNFDGKNCTIYKQRPHMCRDYPGAGQRCEYLGCEWTAARAGRA